MQSFNHFVIFVNCGEDLAACSHARALELLTGTSVGELLAGETVGDHVSPNTVGRRVLGAVVGEVLAGDFDGLLVGDSVGGAVHPAHDTAQ